MSFFQIIEVMTTYPDQIQSLTDEWIAKTEGRRKARHATLTIDRDRPDTYVQFVEFSSYEEAMENSTLPETSEFADNLAMLCDAPPTFRNLDVRHVYDL